MRTSVSQKRRLPPDPTPATRAGVERQLALACGAEQFQHRDPLYHVSESFQQLFDDVGRRRAAALAEESDAGFSGEEERESSARQGENVPAARGKGPGGSRYPLAGYQEGWPVRTFAETAFQRGTLSAAVLQGTGKLMLTSCLKRSIGQSGPKRLQQQAALGIGSQTRNVPGHSPDKMVFNRGFVDSAVGLVVDTLRDARRSVDALAEMAEGAGELSEATGGALRKMYPFLDDSREREMLESYRGQLARSTDAREKAVLQNGMVQTRALIAKKAQVKNEFINKLRLISDRATEALAELEAPGATEEILSEGLGEITPPEPPENPGGKKNAADQPEPEVRPGPGAVPDGAGAGGGAGEEELL